MIGRWPLGARNAGWAGSSWVSPFVLGLLLAVPASARDIGLEVKGGTILRQNGTITVWANSPQAALTLHNPGPSFYQAKIQWLNVPTGAFLTTPQGVSDGASRDGTLSTSISVPGGSQGVWTLEPNLKGNFRFLVTGGGLGGLQRSEPPHFAIHLGNSGRNAQSLTEALRAYSFPTYTLRGTRDEKQGYRTRLGQAPSAFAVNGSGFIFLDNSSGRLGLEQRQWLDERFERFREANVTRSFVFLHLPMVDPRKGHRVAMRDRDEVLSLLRQFKENRVHAVFASHLPVVNHSTWRGVDQYVVGGSYAMSVEVAGDIVSIRRL